VKLVDYTKSIVKKAHEEGFVETKYGRRRPTPDVQSSNFIVRQAAERAAANMPIQGTEADLMKKAMVLVDEKLRVGEPIGEQLLQVHDSILVECKKEDAEKVSESSKVPWKTSPLISVCGFRLMCTWEITGEKYSVASERNDYRFL